MRNSSSNRFELACAYVGAMMCMWAVSGWAAEQASYSSNVGREHPINVYWGDTHVHTSLSTDAYYLGNRIGPTDAYRFARGERITASNGMPVQLRRPLDFLVIADHAESLGVMPALEAKDSILLSSEVGRRMVKRIRPRSGKSPTDPKTIEDLMRVGSEIFGAGKRSGVDEAFTRSVWSRVIAAAEQYNEPGHFTAFIGYEWTQLQANLHRVVIFKDGAEKTGKVLPFTSEESDDPQALWTYLERYEALTGGEVLAIPHNGNFSNGHMFPLLDGSGRPLSREYAVARSRWEPLYEVAQTKGYSETHPFLSPTDEFAGAEVWNGSGYPSTDGNTVLPPGRSWDAAERGRKEGEYARAALKRGLFLQRQLGVNPFKFGLIASTDVHTSISAVDENDFWGISAATGPGPDRLRNDKMTISGVSLVAAPAAQKKGAPSIRSRPWNASSAGYAAVWATENTRAALFAAMKRKETYATTGPRMTVRFFGGWDYAPEDAHRPDLALIGYRKGVPMGGELTTGPEGKAPRFLIRAVKDPDGANLDRAQVVKGWLDSNGKTHERIYNVALSDGRKERPDGNAPPVDSTVDVQNATYTNTIGDPELAVVWMDPDFDPNELAFYYLRVLEIPTPRWTAYDAKFFKIKDVPAEIAMVAQERAYTSPIWYGPGQPKRDSAIGR